MDPLTPTSMSLRDAFAFDNAVANLVRNVKLFPRRFTASLSRLDADRFYGRGQGTGHQDKALALAEWMTTGSEGPRRCIAAYSRKQLRILFDMLTLARPDNEQSALAQSSGVKPYGWYVRELFSDQQVSWKKILRPRSAISRMRRDDNNNNTNTTDKTGKRAEITPSLSSAVWPQPGSTLAASLASSTGTLSEIESLPIDSLPTISQVIVFYCGQPCQAESCGRGFCKKPLNNLKQSRFTFDNSKGCFPSRAPAAKETTTTTTTTAICLSLPTVVVRSGR